MECPGNSFPYLIFIPRNYPSDLHICGGCKVQFTALNKFQEHKSTCIAHIQVCDDRTDVWATKPSLEIPTDILDIGAVTKDSEHINKDSQTLPLTIELLEGNELFISTVHAITNNNNNNNSIETSILKPGASECKRSHENDEEVIAALLANQLSSQHTTDESVMQDVESVVNKGNKLKEEAVEEDAKMLLYRGKMRKLLLCSVEGCPYKTLLRKDYERHERVHTGERPYKCNLCDKTFTRADKLLLHERIHSGDKRHKCTECGYASVDSGSLLKHLRIHNDERPFKCQLCSYRARDSSQLTVHLRTHTGDCPFTCTNSKCKSAFKTNSDLKRHMAVHSGQKPHACIYCPYRCTLKRNLQIHLQSQHPNGELKGYVCRICPRLTLPTIRRLHSHMKKFHEEIPDDARPQAKETAEKPRVLRRLRKNKHYADEVAVGVMNKAYVCKLCDASFVCKDSLLIHERYHVKQRRCADTGLNQESVRTHLDNIYAGSGEVTHATPLTDCAMEDSLRNAEILASLNLAQHGVGVVSPRHFVMLEAAHSSEVHYTAC